jgi:hypothetical protein
MRQKKDDAILKNKQQNYKTKEIEEKVPHFYCSNTFLYATRVRRRGVAANIDDLRTLQRVIKLYL